MTCFWHIFFQKDFRVIEVGLGKMTNLVIVVTQFFFIIADSYANTATSSGALDHDRISNFSCFFHSFIQAFQKSGSGKERNIGTFGKGSCRVFQTEDLDLLRSWSDETDAFFLTGSGEIRILT